MGNFTKRQFNNLTLASVLLCVINTGCGESHDKVIVVDSVSSAIRNGQVDLTRTGVGLVLDTAGDVACTGVLIAPDVAMTAASCLENGTAEVFVYGVPEEIDGQVALPGENVASQSISPFYLGLETFEPTHDVALITLEDPLPAEIAPMVVGATVPDADQPVTVSGWGATAADATDIGVRRSAPNTLAQVGLSSLVIDGVAGDNGNFCRGDVGSVVIAEHQGQDAVIGIHSGINFNSCEASFSTRVDRNAAWIRDETNAGAVTFTEPPASGTPALSDVFPTNPQALPLTFPFAFDSDMSLSYWEIFIDDQFVQRRSLLRATDTSFLGLANLAINQIGEDLDADALTARTGEHTLKFRFFDRFGNAVERMFTTTLENRQPADEEPPTMMEPTVRRAAGGAAEDFVVEAQATDNVGVVLMRAFLDGERIASVRGGSLSQAVTLQPGPHILVVEALDITSNIRLFPHEFEVAGGEDDPPQDGDDTTDPEVDITSPKDDDTVAPSFLVEVAATDEGGVAELSLSIDGIVVETTSTATNFRVRDLTEGEHELRVDARDKAGNSGHDTITVTVDATVGDDTPQDEEDNPPEDDDTPPEDDEDTDPPEETPDESPEGSQQSATTPGKSGGCAVSTTSGAIADWLVLLLGFVFVFRRRQNLTATQRGAR